MEMVSRQLGGLGFKPCKGQVSSSYGLRAWIRNKLGWNPDPDFTTHYLCNLRQVKLPLYTQFLQLKTLKNKIRLYYTHCNLLAQFKALGRISERRKDPCPYGGDILMGEGWEIRGSVKTKKGAGQPQEA